MTKQQRATDEGVHAKVERAARQLICLSADIGAFCDYQRNKIEHIADSNAGTQTWVFRDNTPEVPMEFSVRSGEIVHNLRSALDHLVWQLVIANGHEPTTRNQFPVFSAQREYSERAEQYLAGVAPRVQEVINSVQPFQRCAGVGYRLWTLHCLNIIDKHRHHSMMTVYARAPHVDVPANPDLGIADGVVVGRGSRGLLTASKELLRWDSLEKIEPVFSIDVGFDTKNLQPVTQDDEFADLIERRFHVEKEYGPIGRPVVSILDSCVSDVKAVLACLGVRM